MQMNITNETAEFKKKKKEYDEFFFSMIRELGKTTKFDVEKQTLYLGKDVKSDNQYLLSIMENYKFWISKSMF
jgi:hypothetical protein